MLQLVKLLLLHYWYYLPGNFEIKSAIRVESNGMFVHKELGFDDKYVPDAYKDGIYVFDEAIKRY